ncbi:methionyl-tRNA formyltransferase [Chloroflexota bacterium]
MRVIFMGTPDFSVPVLTRLLESGYDVVAVYTQPDKPSGRGQLATSSPVKEAAKKYGLHIEEPTTFNGEAVVDHMQHFEPDITVVASYGHILPKRVIDMPKLDCLNIHPSLLPKYRGPSPVAEALLAGESVIGVTVMTVLPRVDSGHILAQTTLNITDEDTTASLTPKLFIVGVNLLIDTIPKWVRGEIMPQPQDENKATYTRMFTKEDGFIDWKLPAVQIGRMIRALQPWPTCYTTWNGKALKILEAAVLPKTNVIYEPGYVTKIDNDDTRLAVVTGDGIIEIKRMQLEGKRELPTKEFLMGQKTFIGSIL